MGSRRGEYLLAYYIQNIYKKIYILFSFIHTIQIFPILRFLFFIFIIIFIFTSLFNGNYGVSYFIIKRHSFPVYDYETVVKL